MNFIKIIFIIVIVTVTLTVNPFSVQARYDPGIKWRTVDSGHFVVYYPEGHEAFARRVISLSDEVYGDVTGYFGVKPRNPEKGTIRERKRCCVVG